jgi:hypothetical protein
MELLKLLQNYENQCRKNLGEISPFLETILKRLDEVDTNQLLAKAIDDFKLCFQHFADPKIIGSKELQPVRSIVFQFSDSINIPYASAYGSTLLKMTPDKIDDEITGKINAFSDTGRVDIQIFRQICRDARDASSNDAGRLVLARIAVFFHQALKDAVKDPSFALFPKTQPLYFSIEEHDLGPLLCFIAE